MQAFGWMFYAYTPEGWQEIADWDNEPATISNKHHINRLAQVSEHGRICAVVIDNSKSSLSPVMGSMMFLAGDPNVFYIRTLADDKHVWYEVWFKDNVASIEHASHILRSY